MSDLSANSVFWLSFATLTFTFLSGALVYTIKSKCSSVKCCGCIEIIRDIEAEVELEEHNMPAIPPSLIPRTLSQETELTQRRNSQIMREIIKHINKKNEEKNEETKDSEVIDFTKSMTI